MAPVSYKTLIVGVIIGYLMASWTQSNHSVLTKSMGTIPTGLHQEQSKMTTSIGVPLSTTTGNVRRHVEEVASDIEEEEVEEGHGSDEENGEHGHEHEHEHEEEEINDKTDEVVTIIIFILIGLTIAFEEGKHHIEHTADRSMKPIIASLFGEMTVLGFLSIFTFCVTKLGIFTEISIKLFGEEEEEELLEMFEFVHYMLFFIMVSFVINVLRLVAGARQSQAAWQLMDMCCRNEEYMTQLDAVLTNNNYNPSKQSWIAYLCQSFIPCSRTSKEQFSQELALYTGLRTEFILDRSSEPPFEPKNERKLEKDFNFGRYLSTCLGNTMGHVVEVNVLTWGFFAVLSLACCALMIAIENDVLIFGWVWAVLGWLDVILGNLFDYHLRKILYAMTSPLPSAATTNGTESDPLLSSTLPAWCQIDMDGITTKGVSRQDTLYFMQRKGPKFYLLVFQARLVFMAAYISLLVLTFYPTVFELCPNGQFALYIVISIVPVILFLIKSHESAANVAMVSCIGVHRRPQVVSQVLRDAKSQRMIRAVSLMQKLQHAATTGSLVASTTELTAEQKVELEDVSKTFDALDRSGDGQIQTEELKTVMEQLGVLTTEESLNAMIDILDQNGDGIVSRDEFVSFYAANVLVKHTDAKSLHELAHDMFVQFDQDGSGQITLGEFKNALEAFNVGYTVDEIGDLANELDEQNDGFIGEHEFFQLLEKHKHLFQQVEFPSLE